MHGLAVSIMFFFCFVVGGVAPTVIGALDPGTRDVGWLVFAGVAFSYASSAVCFAIVAKWLADDDDDSRDDDPSSSSSSSSSSSPLPKVNKIDLPQGEYKDENERFESREEAKV